MEDKLARLITQSTTTESMTKLLEQIGLLNQLMDSIPDLIFFKDLRGVYLGCNKAFTQFVGKPASEIIGRTDFECFTADIAQAFVAYDRKMLESGESKHNKEWLIYPDGSRVFVDTLKAPLKAHDGSFAGVFGISRDITYQYFSEEKLKSSEANFRTFYETIDDLIFICNQQGEIFYANPAVTRKLGYSFDELQGMHVLDVHPEPLRQQALKTFADMFAGIEESCSLPLSRKDGGLMPVETRVWFGKWDNQDCLFGMSKDLSKEQESLQRFNKIFQANPTPIAISSIPDGCYTDVNDAFTEMTGFSRQEVLGRTSAQLQLFPDQDAHARAFDILIQNDHLSQFELKVRKKNGEILLGQFSGEIIESQGQQFALTVMIDQTRNRLNEQALNYQANFQDMLMKISTKYINLPLEDVDSAINHSLKEIGQFVSADRVYVFDYNFEQRTTSNIYEWCQPGISPQIDNLQNVSMDDLPDWVSTHQQGLMMAIENVCDLKPDSPLRQILETQKIKSLLTLPLMSGSDCIGFVGFDSVYKHKVYSDKEISLLVLFCEMLVNIRNREKQELKLKRAKEQAEIANQAKSQFLANMSHEIRTPMNSVMGYLQLLRIHESRPDQLATIGKMMESANILLSVINDILDVSKIEAGKLELENIQFALRPAIEAAVSPLAFRAAAKGVEFNVTFSEDVPEIVEGDPLRLQQILTNLCSNAVKFTERGFIHTTVSLQGSNGQSDTLFFTVEDTGIGMDQASVVKLFTPFTQADSTLTRRFGGTGLGLSICKELIQLMDGHLWVESELGRGSRFKFTIPFKRPYQLQTDRPPVVMAPILSFQESVNLLELLPGLEHLAGCLRESDLQAIEELEKIKSHPLSSFLTSQISELEHWLDQFDFDRALLLLRDMVKSINGAKQNGS